MKKFIKYIYNEIKTILFVSHPQIIELFASLNSMMWGVWFFVPNDTYYRYPVYQNLAQQIPAYSLGTFFLIFGALKLTILLQGNCRVRKYASFVSIFIWMFFLSQFFQGDSGSILNVVVLLLVVIAIWAYIRLSIQCRQQKDDNNRTTK